MQALLKPQQTFTDRERKLIMNIYEREEKNYRRLNSVARPNGVLLFGSSFAKDIPVGELRQDFDLSCDVYNRSYTDLSVFDAPELLGSCMTDLAPRKVLLGLGETDLERGFKTVPEIISAYEKLIENIRSYSKRCRIVLISVPDEIGNAGEFNKALEALASRSKCVYADLSSAYRSELPTVKAFSMLRFFILDRVSLSDVMLGSV